MMLIQDFPNSQQFWNSTNLNVQRTVQQMEQRWVAKKGPELAIAEDIPA